MTGRCAGKLALVTGAAQGLGRAHATRLAEEGARVLCTDINGKGAAESAALPGPPATITQSDSPPRLQM